MGRRWGWPSKLPMTCWTSPLPPKPWGSPRGPTPRPAGTPTQRCWACRRPKKSARLGGGGGAGRPRRARARPRALVCPGALQRGAHRLTLLERVDSPEALRALDAAELPALCEALREEIISVCGRVGGHLGASLGAVELVVALHRVFHSPKDALVFDVGHQAYAHKLLTGRRSRMHTLRQEGGVAPFWTHGRAPTTPSPRGMPVPRCPSRWAWPRPWPTRTASPARWRWWGTVASPAASPSRASTTPAPRPGRWWWC